MAASSTVALKQVHAKLRSRLSSSWGWLARFGPAIGVGLSCVIGILHARYFWASEIDDAFITFRYAENIVRGDGPTYNPGERVEGTSSLGFSLVVAIGIALGVDPLTWACGVGLAAFVAIIALAGHFVHWLLPERPWLGAAAALMVACSTPLAFHSVAGMETGVYALSLFFGVFVYLRYAAGEARLGTWPIALGVAAWLRPEGAAFFGLLAALELARAWARSGARVALTASARACGWFALVFGPLLLFRIAYFGALLPNSVLAKSGYTTGLFDKPLASALETFLAEPRIVEFWGRSAAVLLPLVLAALLTRRLRHATTTCLLVVAGNAAVHLWNAGDWMPNYRLMAPAVAPLVVSVITGIGPLQDLARKLHAGRVAFTAVAGVVIAVGCWRQSDVRGWSIVTPPQSHEPNTLGRSLAEIRRMDDTLATDLAGRVPYESKMRTLDLFGLCDRAIALHGTSAGRFGKQYWPRVAEVRPSFFYFQGPQEFRRMYVDPSFAALRNDYLYVATPVLENDPRFLLVHKDRPDRPRLELVLQAELLTLEEADILGR